MREAAVAPLVSLAAAALLAAGCGDGDEDRAPPPQPAETADPLPELPRGWKRHVNRRAGFAIGVPPGWSSRDRRTNSLFRSPDRLAAVSVSSDRSPGGLELPLEEFATSVVESVPKLKRLEVEPPRPFRARYPAVSVTASARAAPSGVPQRVMVVVERRKDLATYTVVVARNAARSGTAQRKQIARMIRTLRGRPARV